MKKVSKQQLAMETTKDKPAMTVGLGLGDRYSQYCLLNEQSEVVKEGRIQNTESAFRRHFEGEARLRIALECGTHSPSASWLLKNLGHQVIVANARKIPAHTGSEFKNDCNDAELLAALRPTIPNCFRLSSIAVSNAQRDLTLIQVRSTLVRARTMMANALRGLVKSARGRLPACSTESLPIRAKVAIPPALKAVAPSTAPADRSAEPTDRLHGRADRKARQKVSRDHSV